jgi:lantibiotic modifying enzyme
LGNLELVLEAVQRLDAERWKPHLDRLAAQILADISRNGWYCGTSHAIESPGLMTGLAGIGYGLLRVADPQATPSVLTLEAPAGNLPALGERSVAQVNA